MKIQKLLAFVAAASLVQPLVSQAHDEFQLKWHGTLYTTDSGGNLVIQRFSDKDIVQVIAQREGVSPNDLVLVYRADALDTAVVDKATGGGQINVDYLQLPDVSFTNTDMIQVSNGSEIVRHASVIDEYHNSAIGTITGFERQKLNSDGTLKGDKFRGSFQFAYPAGQPTGGFPYGIYSGTFSTGKRIIDQTGAGS